MANVTDAWQGNLSVHSFIGRLCLGPYSNAIEPTPGNRQSFSVAHQTPGDAPVSSETKRREDLEASIHSGNPQSHGTLAAKMDECNSEIGMYLGVMYFVVEGCRRDEGFGDELSEWGERLLSIVQTGSTCHRSYIMLSQ